MQDFRNITKKNHSAYKTLYDRKIKTLKLKHDVYHGFYCVKILENCELQVYQLRALHMSLLPICKGYIRFWFYVNFNWPLTSKPSQRMGTGKGKVHHWVTRLTKGHTIMSFSKSSTRLRCKVFKMLYTKFPVKIKIFSRLK